MHRVLIWLVAGIASCAVTMLAFFPASWVAAVVEQQTAGRLTLGEAHGTLWRGSAFIGGAASKHDPVTPLLPGRFSWRLSPLALLGMVDIELANSESLTQTVHVTGNWKQWLVSPSALLLPAERLAALGAPMNTLQPSGVLRLSWQALQISRQDTGIALTGPMKVDIDDIASRISPVRPLGSYVLALDWHGKQATVTLSTGKGPLLLNGSGVIENMRLQFSGKAEAESGQEERLANFLNLLGQRRREGNRDVIALEFK